MAPARVRQRGRSGVWSRKVARFATSRVVDAPDESDEGKSEDLQVENSSSDSDEPTEISRPYNTLLEVFNVGLEREEHRRKRRKLHTVKAKASATEDKQMDSEDDELRDAVSEAEEPRDEVSDQGSMDEDGGSSDGEDVQAEPFETHFANPDSSTLESLVSGVTNNGWRHEKQAFKNPEKYVVYRPKDVADELSPLEIKSRPFTATGIKKKLQASAIELFESAAGIERRLASCIFGYHDVLFSGRTTKNASTLRSLSCLHALNHIFKSRDKILKHNARIAADDADPETLYRDQGYTRPKILVVVPTRQSCSKIVSTIVDLCKPEQQENRKRFDETYVLPTDNVPEDRPDDFKELFEGNDDDMFRLGIKFTRKTVKYFAQFYNSDIIIASPLGLRRAIESGGTKNKDYDFLSSIEITIIDQADGLLMQNWEHVTFVMSHLNLSPKEAHGCDFSRVRMWYLDDQAKYLRQTIVLSAFTTPEINSLFNNHMSNVDGKVKHQPTYDGSMLSTGLPIKQRFSRFQAPNLQADPDARFSFFTSTIVPWILKMPRPLDGALGLLIFIPSYFDFVRLRNYFSTSPAVSSVAFGAISENNNPAEPEVRRARSHFISGKHSVLLYTGRAHHFFRYLIKGVKAVVFYQLPDNPSFYREAVRGFLGASITAGSIAAEEGKARVLFSKWDALRLERVVGSDRMGSMLGSGDTFDFV